MERKYCKGLPPISESLAYAMLTKNLDDGIYRVEVSVSNGSSLRAWLEVVGGKIRSMYAKFLNGSESREVDSVDARYALLRLLLAHIKNVFKLSFATPTEKWYHVTSEDLLYALRSIANLYSC